MSFFDGPKIFGLLLAWVCVGCATSSGIAADSGRLPFHVAVVGVSRGPAAAVAGANGETPPPLAMRFRANSRLLSTVLAQELVNGAFTRASVIFVDPSTGLSGLHTAVRQSGADMVLLCQLDYEPEIRYERTSPTLLNVGLFLVGGPFIWLIDEYSYYAQASLKANLYDLSGVDTETLNPGDPQAQILATEMSFAGIETDFLDRVPLNSLGDASSYVASLFTSTFLVGQEGDDVADMVSLKALSTMGAQLADQLLGQRELVLNAGSPARLAEMSLAGVEVSRDDLNFVDIRAQVTLFSAGGKEQLSRFRMEIGRRVEEWELGLGVPVGQGTSAGLRYDIHLLIPDVEQNVATFRMTFMGGAEDRSLRSYTLAVSPVDQ
ncbi:MAG: hypothetical protein ACI9EF_001808 [Pseudohongiellaceae bacterium]|jgi:hypothetical protein